MRRPCTTPRRIRSRSARKLSVCRLKRSPHAKALQLDATRLALRGGDRHGPVEKGELGRAGLEAHEGAEEIAGRIDVLAAREPRPHARRGRAQTPGPHPG